MCPITAGYLFWLSLSAHSSCFINHLKESFTFLKNIMRKVSVCLDGALKYSFQSSNKNHVAVIGGVESKTS
jgi:hypothetical protein